MLLAITAATATLTLGLVLHGVTSQPYQQPGRDQRAGRDGLPRLAACRARAAGHRVRAAQAVRAQAGELARAPGVTGSSGP
jgi:hypothetical protein